MESAYPLVLALLVAIGSLGSSVAGVIWRPKSDDWPPRRVLETSEEIPF